MNIRWTIAAAVGMGTFAVGAMAHAAEKDESSEAKSRSMDAVADAVELTLGTGYTQGIGNVGENQSSLGDLGTAGGEIQGSVGYRLIPHLTLGACGSWAMYGRGDQADPTGHIYSSTAGVQAQWHVRPSGEDWDPWISLGMGWRGHWMTADQGTTAMHGMQLAKLQLGIDYRVSQQVAVSPVVGVDLSTFFVQSKPNDDSWRDISSPDVNAFVFAGMQGRFDIPIKPQPARVGSR